jgi:integrase
MQTHNIRDVVKRLLRDIDLTRDRYSAHSLRHTTATLALERGANIEEVQQQLRHKDPKTTLIYMHQIRKRKDSIEHQISDELLGPIKKQK